MTPEADRSLAKAQRTLEHARTMLTVELAEDAGGRLIWSVTMRRRRLFSNALAR